MLPLPAAIAGAVFLLFALVGAVGRLQSSATAAAVPTPALPIVMIATPTAAPAMQVAAVLPRFVVAFDQPVSGAVLGPIPAPDASQAVARYGDAWVMVPWDGGYAWLRAADVGLPDVADLAPPPAPEVIYVASQPRPAPAPAYAAPTPEVVYQGRL